MLPTGISDQVEKAIFSLNTRFIKLLFLSPRERAADTLLRQQQFYTFYNLADNWSHFSRLLHPLWLNIHTQASIVMQSICSSRKTRAGLHAKEIYPVEIETRTWFPVVFQQLQGGERQTHLPIPVFVQLTGTFSSRGVRFSAGLKMMALMMTVSWLCTD